MLHEAQVVACSTGDVAEIAGTIVGHGAILEVSPDAFDEVHVGRVGGQVVDQDLVVLSLDACTYELRAVRVQSNPDDEQRFADRALRGFEKLDDLWTLDRTGEQSEVEAPVAQVCNDGELLLSEAVLQELNLASPGPRSRATRSLGQTRFVGEDDYSALSRSDSFSSRHLLAFLVRTARSSRSRAWPAGRCTLQPSRSSNRQTEESTIFAVNVASISCEFRGRVHRSVGKPAAIARFLRSRTNSLRCAPVSRSGRQKCGARRNASMPPSWRARSQHIMVWRESPTCRATSAWFSAATSNFAQRRQRRSSAFSFCECLICTSNVIIRGTWTAREAKSVTHLRISQ